MQITSASITNHPPEQSSPPASMQYHIFLGFLAVVAAYPGIIHDEAPQIEEKLDHHGAIGESEHHHHVQHEHAKSHQSIKFEHFHPVPVYVKKEHSHLLHHPLEKGKHEQELKQIHPETQHNHGHGLVLEDHRFDTEHLAAALQHHGGLEHHGSLEHQAGLEHHGFEHHAALEHEDHQGGLEHHGGFEASEGLKAYAEEPASHENYFAEHAAHALSEDSGHGYGHY